MKLRAFILILTVVGAAIGQERYVRPFDEAKVDASFLAFRTKLIAAAERRDANFIYGILDPKIRYSFGTDEDVQDFKEMWHIGDADTKFWSAFLPVIKNGGAFLRVNGKRTGKFFAPYTFAKFPDDLDAFEHSMIFGKDVDLRERADANSPVVAKLAYNVVKTDDDAKTEESEWINVQTLGGLKGFVMQGLVRSSLDYRAGFEKKRGQWKMVLFVSGD